MYEFDICASPISLHIIENLHIHFFQNFSFCFSCANSPSGKKNIGSSAAAYSVLCSSMISFSGDASSAGGATSLSSTSSFGRCGAWQLEGWEIFVDLFMVKLRADPPVRPHNFLGISKEYQFPAPLNFTFNWEDQQGD